jgi:hypothetical protein
MGDGRRRMGRLRGAFPQARMSRSCVPSVRSVVSRSVSCRTDRLLSGLRDSCRAYGAREVLWWPRFLALTGQATVCRRSAPRFCGRPLRAWRLCVRSVFPPCSPCALWWSAPASDCVSQSPFAGLASLREAPLLSVAVAGVFFGAAALALGPDEGVDDVAGAAGDPDGEE